MNKIQFFGLRYRPLQFRYKTLQVVTCNARLGPGALRDCVVVDIIVIICTHSIILLVNDLRRNDNLHYNWDMLFRIYPMPNCRF